MTPALDVVVSNLILGADPTLEQQRRECERQGKEFWVYEIGARNCKPEMVRWQMGWLFWQTRARVHLSWCWTDFVGPDAKSIAAPRINDRLRGYRAGVSDYLRLERLPEDAQARRRAMWDGEGWPYREWVAAHKETGSGANAVPDFDFGDLVPVQ